MDQTLRKALYILLLSLGLAVVFNYLFFSKTLGISVFVFNLALLGTVFGFARYQQLDFGKSSWLAVPILFFALMPAVRASEVLTFFNVVATFGLLMVLAYQLTGIPVILMQLRDYATLGLLVPFHMLGRAAHTVSALGRIHSTVKSRDVWVRVLKGVLMAVPILIIFGALFSHADLAFSQFLGNFIHINISERSIQYLALLTFAFVAGLCYLSYIFVATSSAGTSDEALAESEGILESRINSGRHIETLVSLSLVACLFLLFIGFQVTYLFGGETNIASTGFTYAEYARRGFFELLAVAALSLLVLLASEKYAGTEEKKDKHFLVPALVLIAEVAVVIMSAFKRLALYIDAYGLTSQRFYIVTLILVLLILFILLAVKFIQSKPENFFAFGTLLTGIVFLILINLINPDPHIANYNLKRYSQTGKIDAYYIANLSADAASQQIEMYNKLQGADRMNLEGWLPNLKNKLQAQTNHWQSANLSRSRALRLLKNIKW